MVYSGLIQNWLLRTASWFKTEGNIMKFTIDRSIWRCGLEDPVSKHGKGLTRLLNNQGFMCCLGICSGQLGIEKSRLLGCALPAEVREETIFCEKDDKGKWQDTQLTNEAFPTNDSWISREEREEKLIAIFNRHGHELEFVNEYTTEPQS